MLSEADAASKSNAELVLWLDDNWLEIALEAKANAASKLAHKWAPTVKKFPWLLRIYADDTKECGRQIKQWVQKENQGHIYRNMTGKSQTRAKEWSHEEDLLLLEWFEANVDGGDVSAKEALLFLSNETGKVFELNQVNRTRYIRFKHRMPTIRQTSTVATVEMTSKPQNSVKRAETSTRKCQNVSAGNNCQVASKSLQVNATRKTLKAGVESFKAPSEVSNQNVVAFLIFVNQHFYQTSMNSAALKAKRAQAQAELQRLNELLGEDIDEHNSHSDYYDDVVDSHWDETGVAAETVVNAVTASETPGLTALIMATDMASQAAAEASQAAAAVASIFNTLVGELVVEQAEVVLAEVRSAAETAGLIALAEATETARLAAEKTQLKLGARVTALKCAYRANVARARVAALRTARANELKKRVASVTALQCAYRTNVARARVAELRTARANELKKRVASVTALQCAHRANVARASVAELRTARANELKKRVASVTALQCAYRAKVARASVAALRRLTALMATAWIQVIETRRVAVEAAAEVEVAQIELASIRKAATTAKEAMKIGRQLAENKKNMLMNSVEKRPCRPVGERVTDDSGASSSEDDVRLSPRLRRQSTTPRARMHSVSTSDDEERPPPKRQQTAEPSGSSSGDDSAASSDDNEDSTTITVTKESQPRAAVPVVLVGLKLRSNVVVYDSAVAASQLDSSSVGIDNDSAVAASNSDFVIFDGMSDGPPKTTVSPRPASPHHSQSTTRRARSHSVSASDDEERPTKRQAVECDVCVDNEMAVDQERVQLTVCAGFSKLHLRRLDSASEPEDMQMLCFLGRCLLDRDVLERHLVTQAEYESGLQAPALYDHGCINKQASSTRDFSQRRHCGYLFVDSMLTNDLGRHKGLSRQEIMCYTHVIALRMGGYDDLEAPFLTFGSEKKQWTKNGRSVCPLTLVSNRTFDEKKTLTTDFWVLWNMKSGGLTVSQDRSSHKDGGMRFMYRRSCSFEYEEVDPHDERPLCDGCTFYFAADDGAQVGHPLRSEVFSFFAGSDARIMNERARLYGATYSGVQRVPREIQLSYLMRLKSLKDTAAIIHNICGEGKKRFNAYFRSFGYEWIFNQVHDDHRRSLRYEAKTILDAEGPPARGRKDQRNHQKRWLWAYFEHLHRLDPSKHWVIVEVSEDCNCFYHCLTVLYFLLLFIHPLTGFYPFYQYLRARICEILLAAMLWSRCPAVPSLSMLEYYQQVDAKDRGVTDELDIHGRHPPKLPPIVPLHAVPKMVKGAVKKHNWSVRNTVTHLDSIRDADQKYTKELTAYRAECNRNYNQVRGRFERSQTEFDCRLGTFNSTFHILGAAMLFKRHISVCSFDGDVKVNQWQFIRCAEGAEADMFPPMQMCFDPATKHWCCAVQAESLGAFTTPQERPKNAETHKDNGEPFKGDNDHRIRGSRWVGKW